MTRRYGLLAVLVVLVGVGLGAWSRIPRRSPKAEAPAAAALPASARVVFAAGRMSAVSVPVGSRVRLSIENRHTAPLSVRLAGYEDRIAPPVIAPGATWQGELLADRPGDDFAWMVGGVPVGRFQVRGSHLVEGHR